MAVTPHSKGISPFAPITRRGFMGRGALALGAALVGDSAAATPRKADRVAQYWGRLLDTPFLGETGQTHVLSDWAGHPLVVNFYATWCAPCRYEMPSMDALAAMRPRYAVLPISIERGGMQPLQQFYAHLGLRNLGVYQDHSGALAQVAQVWGYPTTLLVNAQGVEVERVFDALHWSSPSVVAWLDTLFRGGGKPG